MPRLDNSDPDVIEWFDLEYDPEDPGATRPIDVCKDCAEDMWTPEQAALDHPPYEDDGWYNCEECGIALGEEDN